MLVTLYFIHILLLNDYQIVIYRQVRVPPNLIFFLKGAVNLKGMNTTALKGTQKEKTRPEK